MNRAAAYALLSVRLNRLRGQGYSVLVPFVGRPPLSEAIRLQDEEITIEIAMEWADEKRDAIRIRGSALDQAAGRRSD